MEKPRKRRRAAAVAAGKLTLSVPEAAELIGIGQRVMWDLVARKQVPVVRIGARVLIPKAQLEEWLRARATA